MSHINPGDERAHTDHDEKLTHAKALVAKVRALITADQPAGTPACNECAVSTLMLALGLLGAEIATATDFDEMVGSARRFDTFAGLSEKVRDTLIQAACQTGDVPKELVKLYALAA